MIETPLLISEPPLQVLPSLAEAIGLNEAIFLQQLHYWLLRSEHERDDEMWVYNSLDEWQEQFPFWSLSTVRRIIERLEEQGLVVSAKLEVDSWNQRKWYRIDYEELNEIYEDIEDKKARKSA